MHGVSGGETQFLVELDHVKSGAQLTPDAARSFVEHVIFSTLARVPTNSARTRRSSLAVLWPDGSSRALKNEIQHGRTREIANETSGMG
jgi:hypothetical protein